MKQWDGKMKKIKIIGFYKREKDGNEYICYSEDERMCLTNGVYIWRNFIKTKFIPQLKKVNNINLIEIENRLKQYHPYSLLLKKLKECDEMQELKKSVKKDQPDKCIYGYSEVCCYPINDCKNCPARLENHDWNWT